MPSRCTNETIVTPPSELILALLYPLLVGLGRIESTGILKQNGVFRFLTGLERYPDATTLRRFLLRFSQEGLETFLKFHEALRKQMLISPRKIILDLDSTVLTVYGRQEGAEVGYNPKKRGRSSYHPLLCFEGITRDIWEGRFHPGNVHSASVAGELLKRAFAKIPSSVRQIRVRADNAFFDHEIIEFLKERRAFYAIVAKLSRPVKARLGSLRLQQVAGETFAAEFRYQPMRWKTQERFIVIRRPIPEEPSWQLSLFQMKGFTYQAIVTNLSLTPYRVWRFYNDRAEAELVIRELKEAYSLGKIPTRIWKANVAYFHLVCLAYNLLNWFNRFCLPEPFRRASLITHSRQALGDSRRTGPASRHASFETPGQFSLSRGFQKNAHPDQAIEAPEMTQGFCPTPSEHAFVYPKTMIRNFSFFTQDSG